MQRLVHLVDRRGATPGVEPGAVEARHVRRTEGLELLSTQRGYQVNPTKGFVPVVGAFADAAAHRVLQPTRQEGAHGLWATVGGDPFEASAIAAVSFSAASLRVFAYYVFLFAPVAVSTV